MLRLRLLSWRRPGVGGGGRKAQVKVLESRRGASLHGLSRLPTSLRRCDTFCRWTEWLGRFTGAAQVDRRKAPLRAAGREGRRAEWDWRCQRAAGSAGSVGLPPQSHPLELILGGRRSFSEGSGEGRQRWKIQNTAIRDVWTHWLALETTLSIKRIGVWELPHNPFGCTRGPCCCLSCPPS